MVKKTERRREKGAVTRGTWTAEEDKKLVDYVKAHGDKQWRSLPAKAGLNRCGKSCRLRWLNYLKPGIKRGNMSEDEEDLIIRLHNLLGNRWSLIAGRLPGRTDNEIKNYWNTHLSKRALTMDDLNRKLNYAPGNGGFLPYPSAATETNNLGLCPTILNCNTDKDLEVEDYGLTSWDNNQDGFNIEFFYNNNELDVEDYGLTGWDNNQDACSIEFCGSTEEGPRDIEALYDKPSEYDELIRFLEL